MRTIIAIALGIAALTFIALSGKNLSGSSRVDGRETPPVAGDHRAPVLVELFTSEGCSSCPPADELLSRLEQTQPVAGAEIIALSEHVDYWNRLGWADPYSSALFSARQNAYAGAFETDDVYTPQMIVDGRVQFVGSNGARARDAITDAARSPKATVQASVQSSSAGSAVLTIEIGELQRVWSGDSAEVLLAITESGLRSNVSRGENAGRRLSHTAVVRRLSALGKIESPANAFRAKPTVPIQKDWKRESLKAVIFVQLRPSLRVVAVSAVPLAQ